MWTTPAKLVRGEERAGQRLGKERKPIHRESGSGAGLLQCGHRLLLGWGRSREPEGRGIEGGWTRHLGEEPAGEMGCSADQAAEGPASLQGAVPLCSVGPGNKGPRSGPGWKQTQVGQGLTDVEQSSCSERPQTQLGGQTCEGRSSVGRVP